MAFQRGIHGPEVANFDDTEQTQAFLKTVLWKCSHAAPVT